MTNEVSNEELTLEAARAFIWPFRGMNRPMGELLADGRITPKDLAYAVNQTRNLAVRPAAVRLLQWLDEESHIPSPNEVENTVTVEAARAVIWPFRKMNRPMGQLLDNGQITPKDLAYAADKAKEENVRAAAALLLQNLPEVVVPSVEPQPLIETNTRVVLPTGDGTTLVRGSSDYIRRNKRLGVLKAAVGALFNEEMMEKGIADYHSFRQGERGEEAIVNELVRLLDKRWTVYRNLQLPDANSDLDAVVAGPSGVLVVEIKAYRGSFKLNRDKWAYRHAGKWHDDYKSPVRQANWNKDRLQNYLRQQQIKGVPVFALFVLGREPEYIHIHEPVIPVGRVGRLGEALSDYLQQPALISEQVIAVKKLLNSICPAS